MAGKPLTADEIRNRVVEVRKMRFGDVAPHSRNPKKHPDNQRAAFRGAVREIGFASVPVAYVNGAGILTWCDGHLRGSEVADYVGDVAILDITDAEADLLLVTADPIAHLAQTDAAALDALLRDVQTGDEALQNLLAEMSEDNPVLSWGENGKSAERLTGDKKKQIKPVIYVDEVADFEAALLRTGLRNRGEAVMAIARFYLEHNAERQLDFDAKSELAPMVA